MRKSIFINLPVLFCLLQFAACLLTVNAQSTRQDFPTPVTTNEITGKIPARDIGDARLTSYFYTFNGIQGDIFINVQTSNLNGDIDVSTADTQKSLTKITIYADISQDETGRVIYLRKPEKILLRIQGRSPNDDPATFTIKFAGSFEPLQASAETPAPDVPEVKSENQTDVRVNSVGTIIEVKAKPTPVPKETVAKVNPKPKKGKAEKTVQTKQPVKNEADASADTAAENPETKKVEDKEKETDTADAQGEQKESKVEPSKTQPVADEAVKTGTTGDKVKKSEDETTVEKSEAETTDKVAETVSPKPSKKVKTLKTKKPVVPKPVEPNPLENIKLIILLKDGKTIEHPMSDVFRFNIINGILTVITKDGKSERYSIIDVEKTTIE